MKPKRKKQPRLLLVKSKPPRRKGDYPSNPYPVPAVSPATVSAAFVGEEPVFQLRASDPLSGAIVRFWANCSRSKITDADYRSVHELAIRMDEWRQR